jgi:sec-independent protein translocase protein TatA
VFNLGMSEIVVILVVALVFLGPKKLPELASGLGKMIRELRKATSDIKNEIELDETIRKPMDELREAMTLHPEELKRRDRERILREQEERERLEREQKEKAEQEAGEVGTKDATALNGDKTIAMESPPFPVADPPVPPPSAPAAGPPGTPKMPGVMPGVVPRSATPGHVVPPPPPSRFASVPPPTPAGAKLPPPPSGIRPVAPPPPAKKI